MNPDPPFPYNKRPQLPTAQGRAESLRRLRMIAGIPEEINPLVTAPPSNAPMTVEALQKSIQELRERQDRESLAAMNAMAATSSASYADAAEGLRKMGEALGKVTKVTTGMDGSLTTHHWDASQGVGDVSLDQAIERIMNEINAGWIIGPDDVIKVGRELLTRLTNEITEAIRRAQGKEAEDNGG